MGYCISSGINDSVKERVDKFYKDIINKYGNSYLWMKLFFNLIENRNNYYKRLWEESCKDK